MKALREALTLAWLLSTVVAMRASRAAVDRARRHYAQACDSHERALAAYRTLEYDRAHEGRPATPRYLSAHVAQRVEAEQAATRG